MAPPFIKFPSIQQFRNITSTVTKNTQYHGFAICPIIHFEGTVKLHGTNASVCYRKSDDELWIQSRNNIISIEKDNAGFCEFATSEISMFKKLAMSVYDQENLDDTMIVTIFGEWCGPGVQKCVAISEISSKVMVIFDILISGVDPEDNGSFKQRWVNIDYLRSIKNYPENHVYNIFNFPTWSIDIDMKTPEYSQEALADMTNLVEQECPVSKAFGISGCGEGIVWTFYQDGNTDTQGIYHDRTRFKVKGQKHSVTKVKKLANVDIEKVNGINDAIATLATPNRIDQAVSVNILEKGETPSRKHIGTILQWVNRDIHKEEADTLAASNLTMKQIGSKLSQHVREYYLQKYL